MKLSQAWLPDELERLHPRARAALDALDTWVQQQGWEELLVVEVLSSRDDWARAGCSWCVRLRVYSRPKRQALRNRLAAGKSFPDWEIFESNDTLRCLIRDFPWRTERLRAMGQEASDGHGQHGELHAPGEAGGSEGREAHAQHRLGGRGRRR